MQEVSGKEKGDIKTERLDGKMLLINNFKQSSDGNKG
jgi:hypothetical protein